MLWSFPFLPIQPLFRDLPQAWILVSERLPVSPSPADSFECRVIVWDGDDVFEATHWYGIDQLGIPFHRWHTAAGEPIEPPIAWMPLPEPPEVK